MATTLAVVLGLLAAGMAGVAAWLWQGKARAAAEAAGERVRAERLSAERDAARGAVEAAEVAAREIRGRAEALVAELGDLRVVEARLREEKEAERRMYEERAQSLTRERAVLEKRLGELREQMGETFKALAGETLRVAGEDLLKRAREQFEGQQREDAAELEKRKAAVEQMVGPIGRSLESTQQRLAELTENIREGRSANTELREETARLVNALRRPKVRGAYGEVQLRRVAELAGLREGIHFECEKSVGGAGGEARQRPDMVVHLSTKRTLIIDAKTVIEPYLLAFEATDDGEAERLLQQFADGVLDQVAQLSKKSYWEQFPTSPEFVVMFMPGDQFVDAALSRRTDLLEKAWAKNIILASPTTLIGLLRAVELGWRESALAESADELRRVGVEMHKRAAVLLGHVGKLGADLDSSRRSYDGMVKSLRRFFLPQLRKFEELGATSGRELADVKPLERSVERADIAGMLSGPESGAGAGPSRAPEDPAVPAAGLGEGSDDLFRGAEAG